MRNIKNRITLSMVFLLCVFQFAISQTYSEKETSENKIVEGQKITPAILENLGISTAPNPRSAVIQNNAVFIRQVGDYNQTAISTNTEASEINLLQTGNYNYTTLDYTAKTAIANLLQNGDSNRIFDFTNSPEADVSLDLIQDGNNLNFERHGVNEITKSLRFRQTEASPTIIIRSFN